MGGGGWYYVPKVRLYGWAVSWTWPLGPDSAPKMCRPKQHAGDSANTVLLSSDQSPPPLPPVSGVDDFAFTYVVGSCVGRSILSSALLYPISPFSRMHSRTNFSPLAKKNRSGPPREAGGQRRWHGNATRSYATLASPWYRP